jgi:hypothetical protein
MKILRFIPILIVMALVAWFGYFTRGRKVYGRNCRICAANYQHQKIIVFSIPVWMWDTQPESTSETKSYFDPYLGYSHQHEWTGGGYSQYSRNFVGCGKSHYGPYPQHQLDLTRMGMQLVAVSGIEDPVARRKYFEEIVFPESYSHYFRVITTHEAISNQMVKLFPYHRWGPNLEGIEIPECVRAGKLLQGPF